MKKTEWDVTFVDNASVNFVKYRKEGKTVFYSLFNDIVEKSISVGIEDIKNRK